MKTKISQKGQIVLPKKLRDDFNLKVGDYVEIEKENGFVKIVPVSGSVLELAGSMKSKIKRSKKEVEIALTSESKEVANEGKDN
ncbi:MAG TPA: AbrB/MazE/SpoVT family DNA-binding domain-containing protein [bacterium]|nr:AbrB/MazE/SpoVT family DNA-binding domain-containing protein [bacterium]